MQTVPTWWRQRLAVDHRQAFRMTLYKNGNPFMALPPPLLNFNTRSIVSLNALGSSTRSCTLAIYDPTAQLVPGNSTILEPTGNEIFVEASIDDGHGNFWWVPCGMYGILTTEADDTLDMGIINLGGVTIVSAVDRSQVISASTITETWQTPAGITIAHATEQLIKAQVPWIPPQCYRLNDNHQPLPQQILSVGDNPWQIAQTWWSDVGMQLYVDAYGNIIGNPFSVPQSPLFQYDTSKNALMTGARLILDATNAYNGVTMVASTPGTTQISATVWDTNASSPTYYKGPFGRRPAPPLTSTVATNYQQCLEAATQLLPKILGLSQVLVTTVVADPSLDAFDIAQVVDQRQVFNESTVGYTGLQPFAGQTVDVMNVKSAWVLQSYTLPLDMSQSMQINWAPLGQVISQGHFLDA